MDCNPIELDEESGDGPALTSAEGSTSGLDVLAEQVAPSIHASWDEMDPETNFDSVELSLEGCVDDVDCVPVKSKKQRGRPRKHPSVATPMSHESKLGGGSSSSVLVAMPHNDLVKHVAILKELSTNNCGRVFWPFSVHHSIGILSSVYWWQRGCITAELLEVAQGIFGAWARLSLKEFGV
eukprot:3102295-Amphidinium_carterae.1